MGGFKPLISGVGFVHFNNWLLSHNHCPNFLRWLIFLFNVWPFRAMKFRTKKICPKYKIFAKIGSQFCQSRFTILPSTKWSPEMGKDFFKFCLIGEIWSRCFWRLCQTWIANCPVVLIVFPPKNFFGSFDSGKYLTSSVGASSGLKFWSHQSASWSKFSEAESSSEWATKIFCIILVFDKKALMGHHHT